MIKKNVKLTGNQSTLLQGMVMCNFFAELHGSDFLNSEFFKNMHFENKSHKEILKMIGIGNPATMHFMLYVFLVMPKEMLKREDYSELEKEFTDLNKYIATLVEKETYSTYKKDIETINYCDHLRNAVAHSKSLFEEENHKNYVTFFDNMKDKKGEYECRIKLKAEKVGEIINKLQEIINRYFDYTL